MTHLSTICNGRAIPFLWSMTERNSATVGFEVYRPLLRKASWLLRNQNDVMLLADRGFAKGALLLPLPARDLERCFASHKAEANYYEQLLFSRIRFLYCST